MASYCTPFLLTRRRIVAFRTIIAAVAFTGAAGVSASMLNGCAVSAARGQSAPQVLPMAATSQPEIISSPQDNASTQSLLHQANTSFHAHDWLGALLSYQQVYYSDPQHGRPDDQGLGSFAQARMSLCHTWTGVNDLNDGDYAASHDEMQEALDDDPGNAVAQRMLPRIGQQYRLITAVDDINQRFRNIDGSPDVQSALEDIRTNAVSDCATEAGLAGGTRRQKMAAFNFLRSYEDAYLTNYSLNSHLDISPSDLTSTDDGAPSDQREEEDQYQMTLLMPRVTDMGRFAFGDDKMAEVNQYGPVLAQRRAAYDLQQEQQAEAESAATLATLDNMLSDMQRREQQDHDRAMQSKRDELTDYEYEQMQKEKSDSF